jgi:hypothetical protein
MVGGNSFGLYSVDLAEFSSLYPYPQEVPFFGYKADGSMVTNTFVTDGIIDGTGPLADFETFYFDKQFSDIVAFELWYPGYAMDNLILVVPEPSAGALMMAGAVCFWFFRRRAR